MTVSGVQRISQNPYLWRTDAQRFIFQARSRFIHLRATRARIGRAEADPRGSTTIAASIFFLNLTYSHDQPSEFAGRARPQDRTEPWYRTRKDRGFAPRCSARMEKGASQPPRNDRTYPLAFPRSRPARAGGRISSAVASSTGSAGTIVPGIAAPGASSAAAGWLTGRSSARRGVVNELDRHYRRQMRL